MPNDLSGLVNLLMAARPMRGQQVLPGLYDPTGLSFDNPRGGYSTELGSIEGGGGHPYFLVPSLVPGQVGIEDILAGRPLSRDQSSRMIDYARSRDSEVPKFKTLKEAEEYEQKRHRGLEEGYRPQRDEDLLAWLLQAVVEASR